MHFSVHHITRQREGNGVTPGLRAIARKGGSALETRNANNGNDLPREDGKDVFVHHSDIAGKNSKNLNESDVVEFETRRLNPDYDTRSSPSDRHSSGIWELCGSLFPGHPCERNAQ